VACLVATAEQDGAPLEASSGGTWAVAVLTVVIVIVLVTILLGVIVRKRAFGKTWFPEGFRFIARSGQRYFYFFYLLLITD